MYLPITLLGISNKRSIDVTDLEDSEIELIAQLVDKLRQKINIVILYPR